MREVLVSCREKWNFSIADFHVLGLFMAKKHDLSEKKFSFCHAPLPLQKFVSTLAQSLWKLESWNFGFRSLLGQLDVEFWNFESLGYLQYKFWLSDRRTVQKFGCASQKNKKIGECQLICNMRQVRKRPTTASDFWQWFCPLIWILRVSHRQGFKGLPFKPRGMVFVAWKWFYRVLQGRFIKGKQCYNHPTYIVVVLWA
jgi:hypothetical protein